MDHSPKYWSDLLYSESHSIEDLDSLRTTLRYVVDLYVPNIDTYQDIIASWAIFPQKYFLKDDSALNRMITHYRIQKYIKNHNLENIKVPKKYLILQQRYAHGTVYKRYDGQRFLSYPEMIEKISQHLDFHQNKYNEKYHLSYKDCQCQECDKLYISIYEPAMVAEFIHRDDCGRLSKIQQQELIQLYTSVQFDVGFNNIWIDKHDGKAVIIDTEDKGQDYEGGVAKIKARYPTR